MRTIPKRIQNAYFQLHKSRLLTKGHLDNDAIMHFEKILNSSLPTNDYEKNIYYFIKDLYYDDPGKFLNYINNSNLQCLILYTNNKHIISHFNLQHKTYINWNPKEKKYIVNLYKYKDLSFKYSLSSNSLSDLSNSSKSSNLSDLSNSSKSSNLSDLSNSSESSNLSDLSNSSKSSNYKII